MAEERVDLSPLDQALTRRDLLDVLHELSHRRSGPVTHGQILANALEQHFRSKWEKWPKAEVSDGGHTNA